jgi:hypothetical protein
VIVSMVDKQAMRQMGHLKLFVVLWFSIEEETKVVTQDSQNVCKHGRYFGTWKVSRQMEHMSNDTIWKTVRSLSI